MSFPIFLGIDAFVAHIKEQEENQRENYIRRHSAHYSCLHQPNATFQVDLCDILLDDNYRYLWSNQNQTIETVSTETTTTNEDPPVQDINNEEETREYQELTRVNDELMQENAHLMQENEELTRVNEVNDELMQENAHLMQENEELTEANEELTEANEELTEANDELMQEYEELMQELRVLQQRNAALENNIRQSRESLNRRTSFFNRPIFGTKCIKKNESKTDEECPICLNNDILTKNMLWFNCNHGVCSLCITEFLKPKPSHHKCPLCREKIDDVCLKYNRSEGTRSQILQSENVKELLNSVCK